MIEEDISSNLSAVNQISTSPIALLTSTSNSMTMANATVPSAAPAISLNVPLSKKMPMLEVECCVNTAVLEVKPQCFIFCMTWSMSHELVNAQYLQFDVSFKQVVGYQQLALAGFDHIKNRGMTSFGSGHATSPDINMPRWEIQLSHLCMCFLQTRLQNHTAKYFIPSQISSKATQAKLLNGAISTAELWRDATAASRSRRISTVVRQKARHLLFENLYGYTDFEGIDRIW
jgi:hypothetical protein